MALGGCRVTVRIDKRALDKSLDGRDGEVGHVIAGFAGNVTKEIKGVFRERAGGSFWKVLSSISSTSRGTRLTVTVKRSRPHQIVAVNAPMLVFFWERENRMFVGSSVNHPGSQPPEELILSGINRAGRRLKFSATGRVVTTL